MPKITLRFLPFLLVALLMFPFLVSHAQTETPTPKIRVGILGDSNSDEYRADDNRAGGTPYEATTLSWVELLANNRDIDFGAWGKWGGERRTGYEYNWARSAATTESMIDNGQHTGLAEQIKAGKIDYAIIFIGTNDFNTWNGTYDEVYSGKVSDAELEAKVKSIVSNITIAIETLQAAGKVKIVLTSFADPGVSTDILGQFTDADKRGRITTAINQINEQLKEVATSYDVMFVDLADFASSLFSRVSPTGDIMVGGEGISAVQHDDEPHHLQLASGVGHIGTVGSGLVANFFITALDSDGLSIPTFTDEEILANAGITPNS